eukprot:4737488-Pleurochrysis_carterae.AAC.1
MRHVTLVLWHCIGSSPHSRLDGGHGRHLLAQLSQFVAGLVHANNIGQVRGQGVQQGGQQQ